MFSDYKNSLREKREVYLRIKARPGAATTAVKETLSGEEGETIKIDVAAVPEKGKANQALVKFLSQEFSVRRENIKIISGAGDKIKLVKIII